MNKLSALIIAFSMFGSAAAHAAFQSKGELARGVSSKTGAAQSTVVGYNAKRSIAYIRSEGTKNGQKYIITRQVNTNTGAIKRTSGNQLGAIKSAVARANRNGAPGGQSGDFGYSVRANRNSMTSSGNVKISVRNSGFPGRTEGRSVTLTKTGAIKSIKDSSTDGLKSRW
jgi:hypothetical protein